MNQPVTVEPLDLLIQAASRAYFFDDADMVAVRKVAARDPDGMRECYLADPLIRAQLTILKNPPQPQQIPAQAQPGPTPEPVSRKDTHMKFTDLVPASFLQKEDFDRPALLTIDRIEIKNVAPQGQPPENKGVIYFQEEDRGLVLNRTNAEIVGALYGKDPDQWPGRKIVAFTDPNVSFGGKLVGGIRLRAPKQQPAQPQPAAPAGGMADLDNDLPF